MAVLWGLCAFPWIWLTHSLVGPLLCCTNRTQNKLRKNHVNLRVAAYTRFTWKWKHNFFWTENLTGPLTGQSGSGKENFLFTKTQRIKNKVWQYLVKHLVLIIYISRSCQQTLRFKESNIWLRQVISQEKIKTEKPSLL